MNDLPLLLEPENLEEQLGTAGLLLVDLSKAESYIQTHIPGAIFLDYSWIVRRDKPRMGLLPHAEQLTNVFSALGFTPDTHVVAYDDEGGGRASRLLWTLECAGHKKFSLLNGGLHAWAKEDHPLTSKINNPMERKYEVELQEGPIATIEFILEHLNDPQVMILDARSAEEYAGTKVLAQRGGHIPGAINIEWTQAIDTSRNLRLKPELELRAMLDAQGITPDKTIVTHCQTNHRSAHTFIMLKSLGFDKAKAYPGSWSEWGNRSDTPVE